MSFFTKRKPRAPIPAFKRGDRVYIVAGTDVYEGRIVCKDTTNGTFRNEDRWIVKPDNANNISVRSDMLVKQPTHPTEEGSKL